jgi:hypothetical protein
MDSKPIAFDRQIRRRGTKGRTKRMPLFVRRTGVNLASPVIRSAVFGALASGQRPSGAPKTKKNTAKIERKSAKRTVTRQTAALAADELDYHYRIIPDAS